jgi:hypothetical protein
MTGAEEFREESSFLTDDITRSAAFVPSLFGWNRKAYSCRREADVVMSSVMLRYRDVLKHNCYRDLPRGVSICWADSDRRC